MSKDNNNNMDKKNIDNKGKTTKANQDINLDEIEFKSKKIDNIEKDSEVQKLIEEMHEMEDKKEKKANKTLVVSISVFLAIIVALTAYVAIFKPKDTTAKKEETKQEEPKETPKEEPKQEEVKEEPKQEEPKKEEHNELYKAYEVANDEAKRQAAYDKAMQLNEGSTAGLSPAMVSDILRQAGYPVPEDVVNTEELVDYLSNNGFTKETDLSKLKPGDVCFTVDMDQYPGMPSHVYIFMGWTEEGKTKYAKVVDSHVADFGSTYHDRNIDETINGQDKINYFFTK